LAVTGVAINIIVGNKLGEELFGVYSLSATIYILVGMVAFIGIPFSLTKYTAEFIDNKEVNQQFFTASVVAVISTTTFVGIILYSLRYVIAELFNTPDFVSIVPLISLGLPFLGLYRTGVSRLNGLREMRKMAYADSIRYIFYLIFTVLSVAIFNGGLYWAVLSLVLSDILVSPYLIWATRLIQEWNKNNFKLRLRRLGWFGGQVVLTRIIEELDVRSALLMAGLFLSKTDIGLYSLAALIASAISIIPQAIQKVTGPVMTEFYATNRIEEINSLINQVMKISAFLLTLITGFLILFFSDIIHILYPLQLGFLEAEKIFYVLAFGAIFYGTTVSISPIFFGMERPDISLRIAFIRVIVSVAVTLATIKPLGVIGVALGGAGTGFMIFGFWIHYMHKLLPIRVEWKAIVAIPITGALMVVVIYILSSAANFVWSTYLIRIIGLGVLAALIFKLWQFEKFIAIIRKSTIPFSTTNS